ncbi:MAG: 50S ribosomal L9 C-terminal domain-containing protein [Patescibacteria group bacterium]
MKVIFLKPAPPYRSGDVADVAEGYAQNYLFPHKLAMRASAAAEAAAKQRVAKETAATARGHEATQNLLRKMHGQTVAVPAKASPSGTLYAALTPALIAAALQAQFGEALPAALQAQLPHLKHAGEQVVTLRYPGQNATFTLKV